MPNMGRYTAFLAVLVLVASVFATTVSAVIESGQYTTLDGLKFYVDDIEFDSQNAIISIRDSDDNILAIDEVQEGKSVTKSIAGRDYVITVNKTAQGLNYIAKWAMLTITPGPAFLNAGETADFGNLEVTLNDISLKIAPSYGRDAGITISEDGTELYKERLPEGGYVVREIGGKRYKISIVQTSMGYNVLSKWGKISAEPTTLAVSANNYPSLLRGDIMEEGSLRLRLDDIERDTGVAIVSILDGDGEVISQDEIPTGRSIIRAAEDGQKYQIRSFVTFAGRNFYTWAKLTATPTSLAETNNYPTINVGETLTEGSASVTLEDIGRDSLAALLILDDGTNTSRERVLPGGYVVRTLGGQRYKIRVYQTAPGLNFVSKWAKVTIEPTTLRESTTYAGSSVISVGESAESSDGNMRVRLDDIERDTNYALVSVLDSSDNVVWQDEIRTGSYIVVPVDGTSYIIRSYETAPGINFIAKWARVSIQGTTRFTKALPAGEVLNVGELTACAGGDYQVRLDDIERDSRDAIISILDVDDEVVMQDKVADGKTLSVSLDGGTCSVKATTTAPGLNFIAKWARLVTN
jgi:hypothetical protein